MQSYFIVAFSLQLNIFLFCKKYKDILSVNYFFWLDLLLWCSCVYLEDAGDLLMYHGGPQVEKCFPGLFSYRVTKAFQPSEESMNSSLLR